MISLKNILLEVKTAEFIKQLKTWENSIKKGWDSSKKKWFPHSSLEGGTPTIAYGHKTKSQSEYKNGITDKDAVKLLMSDIDNAINKIKTVLNIKKFDSLPIEVQQALVNAAFRGELKSGHKTVEYIRNGQWSKVAEEYLDNQEYLTGDPGVKSRMAWNATQFREYAAAIALTKLDNSDITIFPYQSSPKQQITIKVKPDILPIDSITMQIYNSTGKEIKLHRWFDIKQGILKFPAPAEPGTYILRLNNSASTRLQVQ